MRGRSFEEEIYHSSDLNASIVILQITQKVNGGGKADDLHEEEDESHHAQGFRMPEEDAQR